MSSVEPKVPAVDSQEARQPAPSSKPIVAMFPDEATLDQMIGPITDELLASKSDTKVYRLAVVARCPDGKISIQDIFRDGHGGVAAGALLFGLAGLAASPLGGAIGVGAGALLGWSADLVNEEAVSRFISGDLRGLAPGRRAVLADVAEDGACAFVAMMKAHGASACIGADIN